MIKKKFVWLWQYGDYGCDSIILIASQPKLPVLKWLKSTNNSNVFLILEELGSQSLVSNGTFTVKNTIQWLDPILAGFHIPYIVILFVKKILGI